MSLPLKINIYLLLLVVGSTIDYCHTNKKMLEVSKKTLLNKVKNNKVYYFSYWVVSRLFIVILFLGVVKLILCIDCTSINNFIFPVLNASPLAILIHVTIFNEFIIWIGEGFGFGSGMGGSGPSWGPNGSNANGPYRPGGPNPQPSNPVYYHPHRADEEHQNFINDYLKRELSPNYYPKVKALMDKYPNAVRDWTAFELFDPKNKPIVSDWYNESALAKGYNRYYYNSWNVLPIKVYSAVPAKGRAVTSLVIPERMLPNTEGLFLNSKTTEQMESYDVHAYTTKGFHPRIHIATKDEFVKTNISVTFKPKIQ